jgi:hypothetical protein
MLKILNRIKLQPGRIGTCNGIRVPLPFLSGEIRLGADGLIVLSPKFFQTFIMSPIENTGIILKKKQTEPQVK